MQQLSKNLRSNDWKDLYLAALFENNKAVVAGRISKAQEAITIRRSELLNAADGNTQERQALDNALFFLQALRSCLTTASASCVVFT